MTAARHLGRLPDPAFWAGRRVLVTGQTGFKGAWLCLWLTRLGAEVSGIALAPDQPSLFDALDLGSRIESHLADIRERGAVRRLVTALRPSIVFHLAAQALVGRAVLEPVETFATNVMGTAHVLDAACATSGVEAVVVATSDKVYANAGVPHAFREDDALGGDEAYGASKAAAEHVVATWAHRGGPAVASGRAGNVIGGGDFATGRLVPDAARAFGAGRPLVLRRPAATRPWQHVLEPLNGYLLLAQALCAGTGTGAWNFGPASGDARPVGEVARALARLWGPDAEVAAEAQPDFHEAGHLAVDAAKAAALGWSPRWRLETALERTVAWYRLHHAGADMLAPTLADIAAYEATRIMVPVAPTVV